MEKSKWNIIIISASVTNLVSPLLAIFGLSKLALEHLAKCLAVDLGEKHIRANSVNPGFLPIRMVENFRGENKPVPDGKNGICRRYDISRVVFGF